MIPLPAPVSKEVCIHRLENASDVTVHDTTLEACERALPFVRKCRRASFRFFEEVLNIRMVGPCVAGIMLQIPASAIYDIRDENREEGKHL